MPDYLPPGARPPARFGVLDHSVWMARPPDAEFDAAAGQEVQKPSPFQMSLTRTRSTSEMSPPSGPSERYYYEDYMDSHASGNSSQALGPYSNSDRATFNNQSGQVSRRPPHDDVAVVSGQSLARTGTRWQPQPPNPTPTCLDSPHLTIPRSNSHRSTRSEDRGRFTLPFNRSETSLEAAGTLADLQTYNDSEFTEGSRTPTSMVQSLDFSFETLSVDQAALELIHDGIMRFQNDTLPDADCEWHRLVSEEFRNSLPKNEIQRQSTIFEVIKSERDYVRDLTVVEKVFINPLMNGDPPVITPQTRLRIFRNEVFQNITDILARHQTSLAALFERQREQHPLILSVADIVLDSALSFQPDYDEYIKQYPIAESRHRRELKSNRAYAKFVTKALQDPRLKKRELLDLIFRPVTRLPRLSLLLEHAFKLTDPEHPDVETMPLTLTILSDFVKSTQPGVAVADAKVKFWSLCEALIYRPGEIIDMDLYNPQRHLVHAGSVFRHTGSEWRDVTLSLLDNYCIITTTEVRLGKTLNVLISRPIPVECLGLGNFDGTPENKRFDDGNGFMGALTKSTRPMYPFAIFHRLDVKRRYTFYVERESVREKWREVFVDALAIRRVDRDVNKWHAAEVIDDGSFRARTSKVPHDIQNEFSGRISGAATFVDSRKTYIVVAAAIGIYAALLTTKPQFKKALSLHRIANIVTLPRFSKLIVQHDGHLLSFHLGLLARFVQGSGADSNLFGSSVERLAKDTNVSFFTAGVMNARTLVVYGVKGFRHTSMQALEAVSQPLSSTVETADPITTFRSYGSQFYVPRDAANVNMLTKTLAISTPDGIAIVEPTQIGSDVAVVPDWTAGSADSSLQARAMLKERCDASRPLGLVQSGEAELMVIYETFGCYITKHGAPARKHGFVRWEVPIQSFAVREPHVLLVGSSCIEVRHTPTGRLLQVIEGMEIRLLQSLPKGQGPILIAMRGSKDDDKGLSDQLIELIPTVALESPTTNENDLIWDEWGV